MLMRILELITLLDNVRKEHGNIPVAVFNEDDWAFHPVTEVCYDANDDELRATWDNKHMTGPFAWINEDIPDEERGK